MVGADRDRICHRRSHRADPVRDRRELPGRGEPLDECRFARAWKRSSARGAPRSARSCLAARLDRRVGASTPSRRPSRTPPTPWSSCC